MQNTAERDFNVTVGEFSGSLESLLTVVQKRKLHISDVSLSSVADEYIEHVQSLGSLPPVKTAEFLVVAATLLLIKSKSLLPSLELSLEEEESIKDLEDRLELYKIYQHAQDVLIVHIHKTSPMVSPKLINVEPLQFIPPNGMTVDSLNDVLLHVLKQMPKVESTDQVEITKPVNIKKIMSDLLKRVELNASQVFVDVAGQDRQEILTSFLALLELVKDGVMLAEQSSKYGEILISR